MYSYVVYSYAMFYIDTNKTEEICKLLGKLVHKGLVNDEESKLLMDCAIILRKVEPNNEVM